MLARRLSNPIGNPQARAKNIVCAHLNSFESSSRARVFPIFDARIWHRLLNLAWPSAIAPVVAPRQGKTVQEWQALQKEFADQPPLPAGWLRVRSRSTGQVYFFNKDMEGLSMSCFGVQICNTHINRCVWCVCIYV